MTNETLHSRNLERARESLLAPAGIGVGELDQVMGRMLGHQVDYADLYFQYSRQESWSLEEGQVKAGSRHIEQGVGVRAIAGEKTGFAYSDEIVLPALLDAATAARAIARGGREQTAALTARNASALSLYEPVDPLMSLEDAAKVALLERVEQEARRLDPRVKQVQGDNDGSGQGPTATPPIRYHNEPSVLREPRVRKHPVSQAPMSP